MRTAIFIQDGDTQIVLTPETEWERRVLKEFDGDRLTVMRGSFFECRGGWVRHAYPHTDGIGRTSDDESLILRVRKDNDE